MIDEQSILMRPGAQLGALGDFIMRGITGECLIGAEIGSYIGESAESFVTSGKFNVFYCIDAWENGYDPADIASWRTPMADVETIFDRRVAPYAHLIQKVKGKSVDVASRFEDGSLDFVYLDGLHTYAGVSADIAAYRNKVKRGGLLGGHDWGWTDSTGKKLADAVREGIWVEPQLFEDGNWLIRRP